MRIVFDDSHAVEFMNNVYLPLSAQFKTQPLALGITETDPYFNWEKRYNRKRMKEVMARVAAQKGFTINIDNPVCAHNIGNNNRFEVRYKTATEEQICCYLHINCGLYGEVYMYVTDYDNTKMVDAIGFRKLRIR